MKDNYLFCMKSSFFANDAQNIHPVYYINLLGISLLPFLTEQYLHSVLHPEFKSPAYLRQNTDNVHVAKRGGTV